MFHLGGYGGPQRSLRNAMALLSDRGSVEFMVPEPGAVAETYGAFGDVTVAPYSAITHPSGLGELAEAGLRLRADVAAFRRELRRRRPDLVVVVTTVIPSLLIAARCERIPAIVYAAELYGAPGDASPTRRVAAAALVRLTAWLAEGVVSCSEAVRRQFPAATGKSQATAFPSVGVEYASGNRLRGRGRYGLADDELCVAVVGNLSRGNGQDVAIRALGSIRRRIPAARLLVVGKPHPRAIDVAYAGELRAIAAAEGVEDAVTFTGTVAEMPDVYAAADVVVNPKRVPEAFGRVAAEALVAGRPVVASRVAAIPELFRDGVEAVLVAPDDPGALADAVCRVASDQALAEKLVGNGRRSVLERFGDDQNVAAWESVVQAVLARRNGH